jgi:hypothetical protein
LLSLLCLRLSYRCWCLLDPLRPEQNLLTLLPLLLLLLLLLLPPGWLLLLLLLLLLLIPAGWGWPMQWLFVAAGESCRGLLSCLLLLAKAVRVDKGLAGWWGDEGFHRLLALRADH